MGDVKAIFGGPTGQREVNQIAVEEAEELLTALRAGEVVGFAVVRLHHDHLSSWRLAGQVGGYSMIGGLEHVKAEVMRINDDA